MSDNRLLDTAVTDIGGQERLEMVRGRLIRTTMRWTFGVYVVAILAASYYAWTTGDLFLWPVYLVLSAVLAVFVYWLSSLLQTVQESNALAQTLQATQETLEARVAERAHTAEQARQEAEQARAHLEKQIWFTTGQAQLGEVMRGEQEIEALAHNVVTHLCRYLSLPVGALYLLNNHQMVLELQGRFAYQPAAQVEKKAGQTFRLGEGLVGEVAQGKEGLLVTDAPAGLLGVTSSLGTAVAGHLFLQPIWYEHMLLGVLVLGHWQPLTDQQTEFVTAVTNSMAVALHTARTRDYINQLLEQVS